MIGLSSLEVNKTFFNIVEHNIKFKCYQDYNERFPWHCMKHCETDWSLIRIDFEALYATLKKWKCKGSPCFRCFRWRFTRWNNWTILLLKNIKNKLNMLDMVCYLGVKFNPFSKTSKITSELKLIWLEGTLNWFQNNII